LDPRGRPVFAREHLEWSEHRMMHAVSPSYRGQRRRHDRLRRTAYAALRVLDTTRRGARPPPAGGRGTRRRRGSRCLPGSYHQRVPTGLTLVGDHKQLTRRLSELTFRSTVLDGNTKVRVLLPDGSDADGRTRYPVRYLYHGGGSDYASWTEPDEGNAELRTEGLTLIVVMPDGDPSGYYTDFYNHGAFGNPEVPAPMTCRSPSGATARASAGPRCRLRGVIRCRRALRRCRRRSGVAAPRSAARWPRRARR